MYIVICLWIYFSVMLNQLLVIYSLQKAVLNLQYAMLPKYLDFLRI